VHNILKVSIFSVCLLIISTGNAFSKPSPPATLNQIIDVLNEMEKQFEAEKWSGALASLERIHSIVEGIPTQKEKSFGPCKIKIFKMHLMNFKQVLQTQDVEKVHSQYVNLQVDFFNITDEYAYDVPPILLVINNYLDEASESVSHDDFENVLREMKEIMIFFQRIDTYLELRGINMKDMEEFVLHNYRAARAAEKEEKSHITYCIAKMKGLTEKFLKSF
jgi:hypothetical protein